MSGVHRCKGKVTINVKHCVNGDGDLDGPNGSGTHLFNNAVHCMMQCEDYNFMPTGPRLTGALGTLSIRMKRP